MKANQATYPVATMCRLLGVSTSGYYAWCRRKPSARSREDARLRARIRHHFERSDEIYGAPKIHADLQDEGVQVGRKRVARLMRLEGLRGVCRRHSTRTTVRAKKTGPAPALLDRDFSATAPNELWVADITYVST